VDVGSGQTLSIGSKAPGHPVISRWADNPRWTLCLLSLILFAGALPILGGVPVYGDDHSSHLVIISHLVDLLRAGQFDFFAPDYNLGFPMYLYYQPLPHLSVAILHLLSFGLISITLAFNVSIILIWIAYPWAIYRAATWLSLTSESALAAACVAPLLCSSLPFGFTLHSVMGLGLYSQTFAMLLFPLSLGAFNQLYSGDKGGSLFKATALFCLLSLSHAFYGIAAATFFAIVILSRPQYLKLKAKTLALFVGATTISLLYWIIPLLSTYRYAGGWPWGGEERWQGYGLGKLLAELLSGNILDQGQLPFLTVALVLGLAIAASSWRKKPEGRSLFLAFLLFAFFLAGRKTFGHLVDVQPANLKLQLFRYIGPLHGIAIFLCAIGLARSARWLESRLRPWILASLIAALFLPLVGHLFARGGGLFHSVDSYEVKMADLQAIAKAIDSDGGKGRIYAHSKVGDGSHFISGLLSLYSQNPMGQSYGVGMHDSLGFYYLEGVDPYDEKELARYNFRYIVAKAGSQYSARQTKLNRRPFHRGAGLEVYRIAGKHGYFQTMNRSFTLSGPQKTVRKRNRTWLDQQPAPSDTGVIEFRSNKSTLSFNASLSTPPGSVLQESEAPNRYAATVTLNRPGYVILKVNYHPWWRAEVDGHEFRPLMLAPSFLGVEVDRGDHRIVFHFRNPSYQKALFALAGLFWLAWALIRRNRNC